MAAYSSFEHQRRFALHGGADQLGAVLWPLSVDGLVVLASLGLLNLGPTATRRTRWSVWCAFTTGVAISLVANIAAAPELAWQQVIVAGWPPIALLLAVELLVPHARTAHGDITATQSAHDDHGADRPNKAPNRSVRSAPVREVSSPPRRRARRGGAADAMWTQYQRAIAEGRQLSGADLDRLVGTNNYGRSVLARWRRSGLISDSPRTPHPRPPALGESDRDGASNVDPRTEPGSDTAAPVAA